MITRWILAFDRLGMVNVLLAGLAFAALADGLMDVVQLDVGDVVNKLMVAALAFSLLGTRLDRDAALAAREKGPALEDGRGQHGEVAR
ncbi:hypothetical protein [Nonomuraea endophytica]|uniref:Uncharacterized protein n=1 Tax=Nonomuraea endophytica TaxID=714136 RepID=A0A7W8EHV0_9ACTN|nr:hypothetical protein [Nonomuraea endophytica]MBB5081340.1 hypothetical protein [Nonomuraea endophytica]